MATVTKSIQTPNAATVVDKMACQIIERVHASAADHLVSHGLVLPTLDRLGLHHVLPIPTQGITAQAITSISALHQDHNNIVPQGHMQMTGRAHHTANEP